MGLMTGVIKLIDYGRIGRRWNRNICFRIAIAILNEMVKSDCKISKRHILNSECYLQ